MKYHSVPQMGDQEKRRCPFTCGLGVAGTQQRVAVAICTLPVPVTVGLMLDIRHSRRLTESTARIVSAGLQVCSSPCSALRSAYRYRYSKRPSTMIRFPYSTAFAGDIAPKTGMGQCVDILHLRDVGIQTLSIHRYQHTGIYMNKRCCAYPLNTLMR